MMFWQIKSIWHSTWTSAGLWATYKVVVRDFLPNLSEEPAEVVPGLVGPEGAAVLPQAEPGTHLGAAHFHLQDNGARGLFGLFDTATWKYKT